MQPCAHCGVAFNARGFAKTCTPRCSTALTKKRQRGYADKRYKTRKRVKTESEEIAAREARLDRAVWLLFQLTGDDV